MIRIPKLLIVDDDPGILQQLKWGLEGYDVITANSRASAIKKMIEHKPNLVTLDLGLPPDADGTTEGFETLKQILDNAPDTRVVIVSGSEEEDGEVKVKHIGAYEYCTKPVEFVSLQAVLKRAYEDYNCI